MQGWDLNDYTVQAIERPTQQTGDNWSADFERRMQQGTTDAAQGGVVDVAGEGQRWEIFRMGEGRTIATITAANHAAAEAEMTGMMNAQGLDPDQYDIRSVLQPPAHVVRTLTTPGQGQQVFTGEWKVVDPNGNEIYRFSGVGNSQSDANAVAIRWLQQNPRHMQGGVEVLPVMG